MFRSPPGKAGSRERGGEMAGVVQEREDGALSGMGAPGLWGRGEESGSSPPSFQGDF